MTYNQQRKWNKQTRLPSLRRKPIRLGNLVIPDNIEAASTDELLAIFDPLKKRVYQYKAEKYRPYWDRVVKELQKRGKVSQY